MTLHLSQKRTSSPTLPPSLSNYHVNNDDEELVSAIPSSNPSSPSSPTSTTPLTNPDELPVTISQSYPSSNTTSFSSYPTTTTTVDNITSAHYDERASISLVMNAMSKHQLFEVDDQQSTERSTKPTSTTDHTEPLPSQHDAHILRRPSSTVISSECEKVIGLLLDGGDDEDVHASMPKISTISHQQKTFTTSTSTPPNNRHASNQYIETSSSSWFITRMLFGMWGIVVWMSTFMFGVFRDSHHMSAIDEICSSIDLRVNSPTTVALLHDHHQLLDHGIIPSSSQSPPTSSCGSSPEHADFDHIDFLTWRRTKQQQQQQNHKSDENYDSSSLISTLSPTPSKKPIIGTPHLLGNSQLFKSHSSSSLTSDHRSTTTTTDFTLLANHHHHDGNGDDSNNRNQERRRSKSDPNNRHGSIGENNNNQLSPPTTTSTGPITTSTTTLRKSYSNVEETTELRKRLELYSFPKTK